MKNVLFLVLLVFVLVSCAEKESPKTILFGEFTSDDSTKIPSEIYLKYTDPLDLVWKWHIFDTIKVENGKFSAEYILDEGMKFNLEDDSDRGYFGKYIYLFPSDSINVLLDINGGAKLEFSQGRNSLFNKIMDKFSAFDGKIWNKLNLGVDRDQFHKTNDSLKRFNMDYLYQYEPVTESKEGISSANNILTKSKFNYIKSFINAEWAHNNIENILRKQYWEYWGDVVDTFDIYEYKSINFNLDMSKLYPYKNLITRYGYLESTKIQLENKPDSGRTDSKDLLAFRYDNFQNNFSGIEKDFMVSHLFADFLRDIKEKVQLNFADSLIKDYIKGNDSTLFADQLTDLVKNVASILPGEKAPELSLVDINGDSLSLVNFKGKVVYIDFWFWGCGGCMKEMEPAKVLEEKYKDEEDIVFLKISIPSKSNIKRNQKYIEDEKLGGVNVVTGDRSISRQFMVNGFPTYIIIDKKGNISNPNAPRPSDLEKLSGELDSLLSL